MAPDKKLDDIVEGFCDRRVSEVIYFTEFIEIIDTLRLVKQENWVFNDIKIGEELCQILRHLESIPKDVGRLDVFIFLPYNISNIVDIVDVAVGTKFTRWIPLFHKGMTADGNIQFLFDDKDSEI